MRKPLLALLASACTALGAAGAAAAQDMDPVNLRIASFGQQSSWYAYAVGLAEILRDELPEGSTIDTPPDGGGIRNPLLVATERFPLAFGMAVASGWAKDGVVAYDESFDNLRALVGGFDQYYLGILVNEPGLETTLDEYVAENPDLDVILRGRGSIGGLGGTQMLELAGAGRGDVEDAGGSWQLAGSFGVVLNQIAAGNADLWIHSITVGHPAMSEAAINNDVSFLEPSEEVLNAMQEQYGWAPAVLPAGSFEGQTKDLTLPGTSTLLFADTSMSDELAYTITRTICEDIETFKSHHRALAGFDCETGFQQDVTILPLHPGAERYYREQGWL